MIRNFREHAANERTFLAWIRTAIAIMAFGFVLERFDLLLSATTSPSQTFLSRSHVAGSLIGVSSILVGATMFLLSLVRLIRNARDIDASEINPNAGFGQDAILSALLIMIAISSLFYLLHITPSGSQAASLACGR